MGLKKEIISFAKLLRIFDQVLKQLTDAFSLSIGSFYLHEYMSPETDFFFK